MSRTCIVTTRGPASGNNVSHAKNRTRRRFLPNLQNVSFFSGILQKDVSFRVSMKGLRTIEHSGGIDAFLMSKPLTKLEKPLADLKKVLIKAQIAL